MRLILFRTKATRGGEKRKKKKKEKREKHGLRHNIDDKGSGAVRNSRIPADLARRIGGREICGISGSDPKLENRDAKKLGEVL